MPEKVFDAIRWPPMPSKFDPEIRAYLLEMQRAVDNYISGTLRLSGDLHVGGYVYILNNARIVELAP